MSYPASKNKGGVSHFDRGGEMRDKVSTAIKIKWRSPPWKTELPKN